MQRINNTIILLTAKLGELELYCFNNGNSNVRFFFVVSLSYLGHNNVENLQLAFKTYRRKPSDSATKVYWFLASGDVS